MKHKEISEAWERLKYLRGKYAYHQRSIRILKEESWDMWCGVDKDTWYRRQIGLVKDEGQILKHLEQEIREQRKIVKSLNRRLNKI